MAFLAVLKAGGAYVRLDPVYPQERLDYIVEDSEIGILLTPTKYASNFADKNLIIIDFDNNSYLGKFAHHEVDFFAIALVLFVIC